ncbi:glutathione S-transferase N-terminal domain-containing protein [Brevundimonas sp.]|uniref:glutathione S-transferase family protein n=1 Tax=Brevundimonas sp. TaxID=1871086 RepID=UPI00286C26E3|nr:glutathione S-transferase N-terminal domain-containing protein [Brevundimonas sp.]
MSRLLGRTSSINVRKALWTLAEVGEPFTHEADWGSPAASTRTPAFLNLNPNGLVPVYHDERGVLWQSNTICRYLARKHDRDDLLPTDPAAAAAVEMWMDWQATELNNAWTYAFMALVRGADGYGDADLVGRSVDRWTGMMQVLDAQLAATAGFTTGATFTVADIVLGLSAHRYFSTPFEHAPLPAVRRWMQSLANETRFAEFSTVDTP